MDTKKGMKSEIDYTGFKITVEVKNPKYWFDKVKQTEIEYGSGYFLFVNQSDGVMVIKHGHTNVLNVVEGMASAAGEIDALHVMIANTIKLILRDARVDLAELYIQGADVLRRWVELRQEKN